MNKKRVFNFVVLAIGISVLTGIIWQIGWDKVSEHLSSVGFGFLILVGINCVTFALELTAWRVLLGPGESLLRLAGAALAGAAVNSLTPLGEGGEIIKANLVSSHVPGQRAVSSLLMWNLWHRATKHVVIFLGPLVLFAMAPDRFSGCLFLGFVAASIVASVPTLLYFLLLRSGGAEKTIRLLRKIPIVKRYISDALLEKARSTDTLVNEFAKKRRRDAVVSMLLLLASKFTTMAEIYTVLHFLGQDTTFPEVMFLFSGIQIVRIFLAISPVAIGVGEGGETALFALLGLPVDIGFAQAFVRLLRQLLFNAIGLTYLGLANLPGGVATPAHKRVPFHS